MWYIDPWEDVIYKSSFKFKYWLTIIYLEVSKPYYSPINRRICEKFHHHIKAKSDRKKDWTTLCWEKESCVSIIVWWELRDNLLYQESWCNPIFLWWKYFIRLGLVVFLKRVFYIKIIGVILLLFTFDSA